jgi:hypothetical protein
VSVPAVDDEPRRTGAVVATAGAAVAGLVLAGVTVFGIASASSSEPAQVDDPIVLYGER